ncbi:hypothetical protein G4Y73_11795 [Wenzhouxiangella sp. XN201]|uniref:hypothetical protein n=1 Tax=Wenzhouxiangella sp. XN201 TaxID=2710755 RepID=UPI0013C8304A|nr:hypothetical protein [Wenzhouxiangella sp. XN201]NEZ04834.1 hypothetical protein [Wenzhouxiangella sp. XN201]
MSSDGLIDVRTLWAASIGQLAVVGTVSAMVAGAEAVIAVLIGSGICLIPTLLATGRYRAWRLAGREVTVGRMLAWHAGKWILTAALFAAVFIGYRDVMVLWLIGGFIAAQLTTLAVLARHR